MSCRLEPSVLSYKRLEPSVLSSVPDAQSQRLLPSPSVPGSGRGASAECVVALLQCPSLLVAPRLVAPLPPSLKVIFHSETSVMQPPEAHAIICQ